MVQDVIGHLGVDHVPHLTLWQGQAEAFNQQQHLARVGDDVAKQFQRRPRPTLGRKAHHVARAGH
jgi:hypothetical protein